MSYGMPARLYPNVRGCGYPPELNCEEFYQTFLRNESDFSCWVSTTDTSVAITELDLERAKGEVGYNPLKSVILGRHSSAVREHGYLDLSS